MFKMNLNFEISRADYILTRFRAVEKQILHIYILQMLSVLTEAVRLETFLKQLQNDACLVN